MDIGVYAAATTVMLGMIAIGGYLIRIGAGQQKVKSDVEYLRRDMNQVLGYFRIVPAETQDQRRRR